MKLTILVLALFTGCAADPPTRLSTSALEENRDTAPCHLTDKPDVPVVCDDRYWQEAANGGGLLPLDPPGYSEAIAIHCSASTPTAGFCCVYDTDTMAGCCISWSGTTITDAYCRDRLYF